MTASLEDVTVLIVGAGIMGTGIAQVAAQAGHAFRCSAGCRREGETTIGSCI